jgi:hypothetical protein
MSSPRRRLQQACQDHQKQRASKVGAWLPWATVENVCRLRLRPSSLWPVFMAVLLTSSRYAGRAAHLGVAELVQMTGLSSSTVKRALALLFQKGLLVRQGRYEALQVALSGTGENMGSVNKLVPPVAQNLSTRGVSKLTPRKCQQADTSPTCIHVLLKNKKVTSFTAKQQALVTDVLTESNELLGTDVGQLPLASEHATRLGLPMGTTYGQAMVQIVDSPNRTRARDFTRAVLALRSDPRVQGTELPPLISAQPGVTEKEATTSASS